jgi:hypothetical protein
MTNLEAHIILGIINCWSVEHFVFYYFRPTAYKTPRSMVQFLVSVGSVCLCTRCGRNVYGPFPSKMGSSMYGSAIPAFRRCLLSRSMAMDTWLQFHYCCFQASYHNINNCNFLFQSFVLHTLNKTRYHFDASFVFQV